MAIIQCTVCLQEHEDGLRHDKNGKLEPKRERPSEDAEAADAWQSYIYGEE